MQRHAATVNLGLVFVLMFGAAFSCGPNNNRNSSGNTRPQQNDLAGGWLVISQTTKGETEQPSSVIMGCIVFSADGAWNYGHNGGSAEGGTYEVSSSRLVMTGDDGTTWGDFKFSSRTSRDLFLESDDQVLHLRYKDSNGCG